ncbi:MAG: hypothetical protein JWM82_3978 [Myxococcales bacterium]|nr:hypothetical protein [Myxococcales bacterium]
MMASTDEATISANRREASDLPPPIVVVASIAVVVAVDPARIASAPHAAHASGASEEDGGDREKRPDPRIAGAHPLRRQ